jgi:hypothetical protein
MHGSRSKTALTDQMVVTDQSAPTATRRYIFRTGKRKFKKKKSSPLLEAESQHFKQQKTASCHSIHAKTTKNQRCKHREKTKISLYFPPPSLSLPPQSSKGKQSLLSPFQPSVNQVYSNKDLVNRVKTILEQKPFGTM